MRRVYTAENAFDAQLVRDRLDEAGIAASVHGQMLTGAVGELPTDARPSVWIEDESHYDHARELIEQFEQADPNALPWTCPHCREENGPAFETCWHCGAPQSSSGTTDEHG
ncbi:MAG: DUF2007 domain-containing protein [Halofilum sp. (in: g-proteobacteria)]